MPSGPGTRIRSPNVATMASCPAKSRNAATSLSCVTQTGHPGPERWITFSGKISRIPLWKMDTVCVPHTSMNLRRSPTVSLIRSRTPRQISGSENLSNKFKVQALFKQFDCFQAFLPVQTPDGESGVDNNEIPHLRIFINNVQTDFIFYPADFHLSHIVFNGFDFHGNG